MQSHEKNLQPKQSLFYNHCDSVYVETELLQEPELPNRKAL